MGDYCYVLRSLNPQFPRKTYVGVTNHPERRLYQHNTEGAGGAKRTEIGRPWQMVCYFSNFPDRKNSSTIRMGYSSWWNDTEKFIELKKVN